MHRTRRLLALSAVSAFLLVGTAACGSSSGSDASSGNSSGNGTTSTAADSGSSTDGTQADADAGGGQDCAATADSNNLSGDSVVLFSADQDEQKEADLTDDHIATVAADGSSMDPGTIEVGAGEMFGVKAEDGATIDAVIIGCAGGQTLVAGTAVGFVITEPGTYPVSLDIAGTDLGTVVVS